MLTLFYVYGCFVLNEEHKFFYIFSLKLANSVIYCCFIYYLVLSDLRS